MLIAAVCTGNTCRSPMLERLLHQALERHNLNHFDVVSAGVAATDDDPASAHAVTALKALDIDLSDHRARNIGRLDLPRVDLFITMSDRHAALLRGMGVDGAHIVVAAAESGGVPDPFGGDLADYQRTAQVLKQVADDFATAASQSGETRRHTR